MVLDNHTILAVSALVAVGHTLAGPDHYLPFIALSKARNWSYLRTLTVTLLCGVGHIAGAVLLGWMTVNAGLSLERWGVIESVRGNLVGWAFLVLGLIYGTWGLRFAFQKRVSVTEPEKTNALAWVLFIVFVLGPCEPLIPMMAYPLASQNFSGTMAVVGIFGLVTVATMLCVVSAVYFGLAVLKIGKIGKFSHALAGFAIALCGFSIQFLGL